MGRWKSKQHEATHTHATCAESAPQLQSSMARLGFRVHGFHRAYGVYRVELLWALRGLLGF